MNSVIDVACFIQKLYFIKYNDFIDEMKLHKLLYLANREHLGFLGKPLFLEPLEAWIYGPISLEVRCAYKIKPYLKAEYLAINAVSKLIVENVMAEYDHLDSWKLSELTHEEQSWKQAREGLGAKEPGNRVLRDEDILFDALKKVKTASNKYD